MSFRGRPLPPNWEEAIDSKSGKSYFIGMSRELCFLVDLINNFDSIRSLLHFIVENSFFDF